MRLFIFGSTGDLVKRKIIPAFLDLKYENLEIIALGRKEFTDNMYHNFICDNDCFKNFKLKPKYHKVTFEGALKCEACDDYLTKDSENFFYSALPPQNIGTLLKYIGTIKRQGFKVSVLIEKPFGVNFQNAMDLKILAEKQNLTDDIYISDHYLFKEPVLNLVISEFKKIKIVSLEKVGLENRLSYDDVGALKDMIQSHFLNIVLKLMKRPDSEWNDFKVVNYIRGQYGNGETSGYVKDLGKYSDTETFVDLILETKSKHLEFVTGKRFDKKVSFIEIDGKNINLDTGANPYTHLFSRFFTKDKKSFTSIDQAILVWKIIEKIESQKPILKYYKEDTKTETVLSRENF